MTEKRERDQIPWKKFRNGGRETIKYRNLLAGFLFLLLVLGGGAGACASVTEGTAGNSYTGSYVVIVNTSADTSESTGKFSCTATESDTSSAAVSQSSLAAQWTEETAALTGTASGQPTVASDTTTAYQTGDIRNFYTYSGTQSFQCIGVGTHCYIWMESNLASAYDSAGKLTAIASEMASVYDGQPYTVLNTMSSGQMSYRDGSGKLSIALEEISGNVSGVYMGSSYEPGITAIHINVPSASDYTAGDMASTDGLLVHEGQHALFEQFAAPGNSKYAWLNEGLSVAAMEYVWGGSDYSSWLSLIADNTSIRNGCSLLYSSYRDDTATDYSMQYLFVRYLVTRMEGEYDLMSFFQTLYGVTATGKTPAAYLKEVTGAAFDGLIADFYTAVIAVESTGKYGFEGDVLAQSVSSSYPLYLGGDESAVTLEPTSAIVLKLEDGATFTVPTDGGTDIEYRIIDGQQTAASPANGSGTAADPWEISSARDLNLIANYTGGYYKLTADINMTGKSYTTPEYFTGTLEGAGHTITGLSQPLVGTNQGTVSNVRLAVSITGSASNIQGLVARVNEGTIEGCVISGTANLSLNATYTYVGAQYGAVAGQNMVAGTIKSCVVSLDLAASSSVSKTRVGGVVGVNSGTVKKCCYKGSLAVTSSDTSGTAVYAGGIAGETNRDYSLGGSLSQCINYGTVTVSEESGAAGQICGLAAANIQSMGLANYIVNCYGKSSTGTPLIGSPSTEKVVTSETTDEGTEETTVSGLLSDEELTNRENYQNWDFETDWTMGTDGPELITTDQVTSVTVVSWPESCYLGEYPGSDNTHWNTWGTLQVNDQYTVTVTDSMVRSFNSSKTGTVTAVISYKGVTVSQTMQVLEPGSVSSLSRYYNSLPDKTTYQTGESFDPEGLELIAMMDGAQVTLNSGFTWSPAELTADTEGVTVVYGGQSVQIPVTVTDPTPVTAKSLTISDSLSQTSYTVGQTLDLSGIRVQITYSDGSSSSLFGKDEFESMGIGAALYSGGTAQAISLGHALTASDSGKTVYLYLGDTLPGSSGAICKSIGTISVTTPMHMEGTEVYFVSGSSDETYAYLNVTGGSGSYETSVKSEHLPEGITRTGLPGDWTAYFQYQGTTSASTGTYSCVYVVTDTGTGATMTVEITICVQPSSAVKMLKFDLLAAQNQNAGLTEDCIGEIKDDTITVTVPKGTNRTALMPNIDYASYTGADCNYWNGTTLNFTTPQTYILTAPDGTTKKTYTVTVTEANDESGDSGEGSGSSGSGTESGGSTGTGGSGTESGGSTGTGGSGTESGGSTGTGGSGTESGGSTGTGGSGTESGGSTGTDGSGTESSGNTGTGGSGTESGGSTGTNESGTESGGSTGTNGSGTESGGSSSAAHVHSAGSWVTTKEATVFSAGEQACLCSGCGAAMATRAVAKRTATVKLNAASLPLQVKKSTTVLKVIQKDAIDSIVSWSSSNKKIVTVNAKTGKITAKKTGTAYITVTMRSGATAKCRITVQKKKVTTTTLKASKTAVTLKKGQKYQISVSRTPLTTTDKLTWKSSKKKVAAVSQKGVITAKKKGTATITVKSGKRKVKIKVTVK